MTVVVVTAIMLLGRFVQTISGRCADAIANEPPVRCAHLMNTDFIFNQCKFYLCQSVLICGFI